MPAINQVTLVGTTFEVEPKRKTRRRKRKKDAGSQTILVGPTAGKTFSQVRSEKSMREHIELVWLELTWIQKAYRAVALGHNDYITFGYMMSLERYNGRSLPWYLQPYDWANEGAEGCPDPEEYEFGYYGHDIQPGTKKFIIDRLVWAEKDHADMLRSAIEEFAVFRRVKEW